MNEAKTLNDYKISVIEAKYDLSSEEQRKNFLQECCRDVLAHIDAPIELSMYEKRLHSKTGFPIVAIDAETQMAKKSLGRAKRVMNIEETVDNTDDHKSKTSSDASDTGLIRAERIALQLAAVNSGCRKKLFTEISYEDFSNEPRRKIARAIIQLKEKETTLGKLLTHMTDEEAKEIGQEQMNLLGDYDAAISGCIVKMNAGILKKRRHELIDRINDINTSKDEKKQLMRQVQELDKEQKKSALFQGEE